MKQSPDISGPVARMAQSRARLTGLLLPQNNGVRTGTLARSAGSAFPRSATMRFLSGRRVREAAGWLVLGLLTSPPARTVGWLRFLPVTTVTRILVRRFANSQAARK
jgi:hypothetical protein